MSDCKRMKTDHEVLELGLLTDDEFRGLQMKIYHSIPQRELPTWKYLCRDDSIDLPLGELEKCDKLLGLFRILEERALLSYTNTDLLVELLDILRHPELKKEVEERANSDGERIISSYRRMVVKCASEIRNAELDDLKSFLRNKLLVTTMEKIAIPIQLMFDLEVAGLIGPDKVELLLRMFELLKRPILTDAVHRYKDEFLVGRYKMEHKFRGLCVLINNMQFESELGDGTTQGPAKDLEKLKGTFGKLGFIVETHTRLKAEEISDKIRKVASKDHSEYDCFVCCIIAHGDSGVVKGVDNEAVKIMDIADHLSVSKCPSLAGKPKLFFVDACQGKKLVEKVNPTPDFNINTPTNPNSFIPETSDFLFGFSAATGTKARYRGETGSVYISNLTEVLDQHHRDLDLLSMLTLVNKKMCKEDLPGPNSERGNMYGQTPAPQFTLTKRVYFN